MKVLGISAFYHDSAAALLIDGKIVAAAQEERFTRKKHDFRFPTKAIEYCLKQGGIEAKDLDYIGFYDKPFIKFERILSTYVATFPRSLPSFLKAIPLWVSEKLWAPQEIRKRLIPDLQVGRNGRIRISKDLLIQRDQVSLLCQMLEF